MFENRRKLFENRHGIWCGKGIIMDDLRYAVLIDSDNISAKYIRYILDEMTKYGAVT